MAIAPEIPAAWNPVAKGPLKTPSCSTLEVLESFKTMSAAAVRRLAYRYTAGTVGRLDLDLVPIPGNWVVTGRLRGNQLEVEHALCGGLSDGAHEMTVQWDLPAGVHRLELLNHSMHLLHEERRSICPVLLVDQPTFGTFRVLELGLMMPVRLAARGRKLGRVESFRRVRVCACDYPAPVMSEHR